MLKTKLKKPDYRDGTIFYRNMQLKFSLHGDPLFLDEESRVDEIDRRQELLDIVRGPSNLLASY